MDKFIMEANLYTKEIVVKEEHLDTLKHVNNTVYLQWAQEIAGEHWIHVTGEGNTEEHYWVVYAHNIQYSKQVFLGEKLTVETFVHPMEGIRFPRSVLFKREGKMVVSARTDWILVDAHTHRPKRLDSKVLALFGL